MMNYATMAMYAAFVVMLFAVGAAATTQESKEQGEIGGKTGEFEYIISGKQLKPPSAIEFLAQVGRQKRGET